MGAVMPEPEYILPLNGEGNTAVYVLSRISGEGNDRAVVPGDILLTETEIRDILELQKKYNKFLLVINTGGPVDLSPVMDVKNILLLSQLGVDTGTVLADLLLGRAYPSGKLTTTWAAWNQYSRIGEFGLPEDTRYKEGIYVGYRYFDSVGERALFPFGHGLSYTQFEISPHSMEVHGEEISVTVNVKNTGKHAGMEVVQLYVSIPAGKLDQPWQTLAAFEKTEELASGAQQNLTLSFALSELACFDEESCAYLLEQGDYLLRVGCSSIDTEICGTVKLDADTIVRKVRPVGGEPDFADWKPETVRATEHPQQVPVLQISADMIRTQNVQYDASVSIDPLIQALSDEELSYLNVGAFDPKAGMLSIIGNAGKLVAGAAGETTSVLLQKGIAPLVMADGPAGLRLSQSYTKDEKGVHAIGETMPQTILDFMPAPLVFLTSLMNPKPKKDAVIHHQYTTAIPIGTAIAQSWNRKLAFACGDIVGEEMEQFGIHLWLAPALNIHRDIRCGRNFEYYSETRYSVVFSQNRSRWVYNPIPAAVLLSNTMPPTIRKPIDMPATAWYLSVRCGRFISEVSRSAFGARSPMR